MRIDAGMPAALIVGNQEIGCFVKGVSGDSTRKEDGTRVFSRIDEVVVIPWRSPYGTEAESLDALERVLDNAGASSEFYEALEDMRCKAGQGPERAQGRNSQSGTEIQQQ